MSGDTRSGGTAPAVYTVVQLSIAFASLDEVRAQHPDLLAQHLDNARRMHATGDLVMAGAILEQSDHIETMAVLLSEDAAKRFIDDDPFVSAGFATDVRVRLWANMFYRTD
jgi:uncharacterized protein YciI